MLQMECISAYVASPSLILMSTWLMLGTAGSNQLADEGLWEQFQRDNEEVVEGSIKRSGLTKKSKIRPGYHQSVRD